MTCPVGWHPRSETVRIGRKARGRVAVFIQGRQGLLKSGLEGTELCRCWGKSSLGERVSREASVQEERLHRGRAERGWMLNHAGPCGRGEDGRFHSV